MKIGILEPLNFSKEALNILSKIGEVDIFSGKNLDEFIKEKEILFIRLNFILDKEFLKKAKNLKIICSPTTGNNHIDMQFIKKNNIKLIYLKGHKKFLKKIVATPEHTLGLIISLLRNYKNAFLSIKDKSWNRNNFIGEEILGNTIGIIGLGRVGYILANYISYMGGKVVWFDKNNVRFKKNWIQARSLTHLISSSKVICLCANFEFGQDPILSYKYLKLMENKYLINTSRGELIDENALIKLIKKDKFSGVALDVICNENKDNNLKKWERIYAEGKNLIITPHIAGATFYSMHKTEVYITNLLIKYINQKK